MTTRRFLRTPAHAAFTLLELMLVVLIIAILAALVLPALDTAKARGKRIECVSQLRGIGTAFHLFANDHGNAFPFQVSTNEGGSREFVHAGFALADNFYFAYRHFQTISNELTLPRFLVCPSDRGRTNAPGFPGLRNDNISYFAGVTADFSKPDSLLSGDGNLTDATGSGAILKLATNAPGVWTSGCHEYKGNILFADGHVEQLNGGGLISAIDNSGVPVNALFVPISQPAGSVTVANNSSTVLQQFFSDPSAATATKGTPAPQPQDARAATNRARPLPVAVDVQALAQRALTNQLAKAATNRIAGLTNDALATVSSAAPGAEGGGGNVFVFVLKPELVFPWWILIMLLAILLAMFLGWKVAQHRRKARLQRLVPLSPLGPAR
jgi:prepilin-type N-terminal cleavage/methylation domain-containing protein/prepilin-type processing-associated H-X9-DG protein